MSEPVELHPVDVDRIRDVLEHTEIIEIEGADLVASPGQVWVIPREERSITMEVSLPEEQFWLLVGTVYGPGAVQELKQELDDWLRWEGEGGPCLD